MTKFWMSQTSFGLIFLQKPSPAPFPILNNTRFVCLFYWPVFLSARGLDNKNKWIFWSGWRMISRTLVPLASLRSMQAGWFPMQCLMSRWYLEPKWNWIGEMIKDHVFFFRFFIFGWRCLICCNNLLVLKWTEIFVLTINQYIPDCFLLVFACCILKKPAAKWAVELEQKIVKSQECLRIDFDASNFHYSTWIQQNSSWICLFDAWKK